MKKLKLNKNTYRCACCGEIVSMTNFRRIAYDKHESKFYHICRKCYGLLKKLDLKTLCEYKKFCTKYAKELCGIGDKWRYTISS